MRLHRKLNERRNASLLSSRENRCDSVGIKAEYTEVNKLTIFAHVHEKEVLIAQRIRLIISFSLCIQLPNNVLCAYFCFIAYLYYILRNMFSFFLFVGLEIYEKNLLMRTWKFSRDATIDIVHRLNGKTREHKAIYITCLNHKEHYC